MKKYLFGEKHYYMYAFDALFDGVVATLTAGTFFAKLTTSLGVSDTTTAILGQVGHLMIVLYLVSSVVARMKNPKPTITILHLCYQVLISTLYLLPFFLFEPSVSEKILLVAILLAKSASFCCAGAKSSWLISNIPKEKQSSVFGISQAIVYGSLFFLSLGMSRVIDRMEERGNLRGAFLIIFLILLAASGLNLATTLLTRRPSPKMEAEEGESLLVTYREVLQNKAFVSIAIQRLFYTVGSAASTSYQATYLINECGLPMTTIALFTAIGTAVNALAHAFWGKVGERTSQYHVYSISMVLMTLACAATIFLSPTHFALPFVLFTVLYNLGHAAYNVGYTVVYRILPERHYASGLAIGVIPQSLVSFFSTLALAPLFNYLKDDLGGTLFGCTFYAQQTFSVIGTAFYILGILYLVFVTNRHMLPLIGKGEERKGEKAVCAESEET